MKTIRNRFTFEQRQRSFKTFFTEIQTTIHQKICPKNCPPFSLIVHCAVCGLSIASVSGGAFGSGSRYRRPGKQSAKADDPFFHRQDLARRTSPRQIVKMARSHHACARQRAAISGVIEQHSGFHKAVLASHGCACRSLLEIEEMARKEETFEPALMTSGCAEG